MKDHSPHVTLMNIRQRSRHRITENDISCIENLYLDESDREKVMSAVIAVLGIGGIGAPAVDLFMRNGFRNFYYC